MSDDEDIECSDSNYQKPKPKSKAEKWSEWIELIFFLAFIIIPFFTGILAYHWLPAESPKFNKNMEIVDSTGEECNDTGTECGSTPLVWRDTITGKTYYRSDFAEHRREEKTRMGLTWFGYGLIGCFFLAGMRYYKKREYDVFFKYFGIAVLVDIGVALFIYFSR